MVLSSNEILLPVEIDELLKRKKVQLIFKRIFDIVFSLIGLIILIPVFLIISIIIKLDSKGPVFF